MERIESLDTLKGLALFAVVLIHVRGIFIGEKFSASAIDFLGLNIARLGVPVFFLISGYLFNQKLKERENKRNYLLNYSKKIIYWYIIANIIYLSLQTALSRLTTVFGGSLVNKTSVTTISQIGPLEEFFFNLIYTGYAIRPSLWFLTALIISIWLVFIFNKYEKLNYLILTAFVLHTTAILSNSYQLIGFTIPPRDAIFFGLIYTSVGFKIAEISKERFYNYRKKYLGCLLPFLVLYLFERLLIGKIGDYSPFFWLDYSFLTLPISVLIILLGLSRPNLGAGFRINTYGKFTLWAYIFHQIIGGVLVGLTLMIERLLRISLIGSSFWNIILVLGTFIATFESVVYYKKNF
jgi:surface polysaccharide O-acyltransferase-like enzyme